MLIGKLGSVSLHAIILCMEESTITQENVSLHAIRITQGCLLIFKHLEPVLKVVVPVQKLLSEIIQLVIAFRNALLQTNSVIHSIKIDYVLLNAHPFLLNLSLILSPNYVFSFVLKATMEIITHYLELEFAPADAHQDIMAIQLQTFAFQDAPLDTMEYLMILDHALIPVHLAITQPI